MKRQQIPRKRQGEKIAHLHYPTEGPEVVEASEYVQDDLPGQQVEVPVALCPVVVHVVQVAHGPADGSQIGGQQLAQAGQLVGHPQEEAKTLGTFGIEVGYRFIIYVPEIANCQLGERSS